MAAIERIGHSIHQRVHLEALGPSLDQFTPRLETQVPDLASYLRATGERVVDVRWKPIVIPSQPLSLIKTIMDLTDAGTEWEIGRHGPPRTAIAVAGNTASELRLFEDMRHGRDSLKFARALLPKYPQVMRSTLEWLASQQGTKFDPMTEEQPGSILHEYRNPGSEEVFGAPFPYYGSIDAIAAFINGIVAYTKQEGRSFLKERVARRDGRTQTMEDALFGAVGALKRHMGNPEGVVEFQRTNPGGIENQSWQDSPDSYFHRDGSLANHDDGIASVEVQIESLNALLGFTELYPADALWTNRRMGQLADYIGNLWVKDDRGGFFALGTDRNEEGRMRRLEVLKSNSGYVLNSPLLDGDDPAITQRREDLIATLFGPSMLNASGIRTLSTDEIRFVPGAYHNGTVWPHDTNETIRGLVRQGYHGLANELRARLLGISEATGLFPESVPGDHDDRPTLNARIVDVKTPEGRKKRLEQPAQPVLAMTVGTIFEVEHALEEVQHRKQPAFATDPAKRRFEEKVLTSLSA